MKKTALKCENQQTPVSESVPPGCWSGFTVQSNGLGFCILSCVFENVGMWKATETVYWGKSSSDNGSGLEIRKGINSEVLSEESHSPLEFLR